MNTKIWCYRYFTFEHLPEGPLKRCSEEYADHAFQLLMFAHAAASAQRLEWLKHFKAWVYEFTDKNPESIMAVKKLDKLAPYLERWNYLEQEEVEEFFRLFLESKDCAVRALLDVSNQVEEFFRLFESKDCAVCAPLDVSNQ